MSSAMFFSLFAGAVRKWDFVFGEQNLRNLFYRITNFVFNVI